MPGEGDLLRRAKQDHDKAKSDIAFMEKMVPFIRDISVIDDASGEHKDRSAIREAFIESFLVPKIEESKACLRNAKVRIEASNIAIAIFDKDIDGLTRDELNKLQSMAKEILDEIQFTLQYAT